MKKTILLSLLSAAGFALFVNPPSGSGCHGNMRWRFMPIAEARKEYARIEAELKIQSQRFSRLLASPELEEWIKYYNNPVFKPGSPGSWEEKSVDCFSTGHYAGRYMMWYVGTPQNLNCQIGLATSPDGIHWTKHPENPVLRLGPQGSWEESILICQSVLYDRTEKIFKMWYIGGNPFGALAIGYVTSLDGIHWMKYSGNPVIRVTEPWEGTVMEAFTVLKMRDGYKMWYGGNDLSRDKAGIGYASSPDGIHWIKHPGNPIFTPDLPKRWDSYSVSDPEVLYWHGQYHMWYKGWKRHGGNAWIGHATSEDGITWLRDSENPVLITSPLPGSWETFEVYRPRVIMAEGETVGPTYVADRMWYSGRTYNLSAQIGIAHQFRRTERERRVKSRFPRVSQDQLEMAIDGASENKMEISYFIPWLGMTHLEIFSETGNKVRSLVKEVQLAGFYQVVWDGLDDQGQSLPARPYFVELRTDAGLLTKTIVTRK